MRLAGEGLIRLAEIDTSYFVGNSPGASALQGLTAQGDWVPLLARTALQPDTRHRFLLDGQQPVTDVRLDIYPDGGLARLRLFGELTAAGRASLKGIDATYAVPHRGFRLLPCKDLVNPAPTRSTKSLAIQGFQEVHSYSVSRAIGADFN